MRGHGAANQADGDPVAILRRRESRDELQRRLHRADGRKALRGVLAAPGIGSDELECAFNFPALQKCIKQAEGAIVSTFEVANLFWGRPQVDAGYCKPKRRVVSRPTFVLEVPC